jgi:hypothetical protein
MKINTPVTRQLRSSTSEGATSEVLRPAKAKIEKFLNQWRTSAQTACRCIFPVGESGVKKLILFSCLMTVSPLLAQTQPPKEPAFEVASVKPSRPGFPRGYSTVNVRGADD